MVVGVGHPVELRSAPHRRDDVGVQHHVNMNLTYLRSPPSGFARFVRSGLKRDFRSPRTRGKFLSRGRRTRGRRPRPEGAEGAEGATDPPQGRRWRRRWVCARAPPPPDPFRAAAAAENRGHIRTWLGMRRGGGRPCRPRRDRREPGAHTYLVRHAARRRASILGFGASTTGQLRRRWRGARGGGGGRGPGGLRRRSGGGGAGGGGFLGGGGGGPPGLWPPSGCGPRAGRRRRPSRPWACSARGRGGRGRCRRRP